MNFESLQSSLNSIKKDDDQTEIQSTYMVDKLICTNMHLSGGIASKATELWNISEYVAVLSCEALQSKVIQDSDCSVLNCLAPLSALRAILKPKGVIAFARDWNSNNACVILKSKKAMIDQQ